MGPAMDTIPKVLVLMWLILQYKTRMIISVVEYLVDIQAVAGSNPASSTTFAAVAHQVEQQIENLCVAGSSPARGTNIATVA